MKSELVKVKDYFELTAEDFDSLYEQGVRDRILNRFFRKGIYERVTLSLQEMDPLKDHTVLDVGSGSGRNSPLFVQSGAAHVTGVDFASDMIGLARDFAKQNEVEEKCTFHQADFLTFKSDQKMDYSVALGVFDYLQDPLSFLVKMKSLTKQRVIASFPEKSWLRSPIRKFRYNLRGCPLYFYSSHDLEDLYKKAGFSKYKIIPYSSSGLMGVGFID